MASSSSCLAEAVACSESLCNETPKQSFDLLNATADRLESVAEALLNPRQSPTAVQANLSEGVRSITSAYKKYSKASKRYLAKVAQLGKLIEKGCYADLDSVSSGGLDTLILDRIIASHLLRTGRHGVAKSMISESRIQGMRIDDEYVQLNLVRKALLQQDIEPCLRWVSERRESFGEAGRDLSFALHRLQFLKTLQRHGPMPAVRYAQANLHTYFHEYQPAVQKLMLQLGMVRQRKDVEEPAVEQQAWRQVDAMCKTAFCKSLGLAEESPLFVGVMVGRLSLPRMMKIKQLEQKRMALKVAERDSGFEIDLDKRFQFHSTFVCPVLKTVEEAPPVLLRCGHVISQAAMYKITKTMRNSNRFKCPTCPQEQSPKDTHLLFL